MSEIKELSSSTTFLYKLVFPIIFIIILISFYFDVKESIVSIFLYIPIIFVIIFLGWRAADLKEVAIKDGNLIISNIFNEIKIPVSEIENVRQTFPIFEISISITLKKETEFGKKIRFVPKNEFYWSGQHPTVKYLRGRINKRI